MKFSGKRRKESLKQCVGEAEREEVEAKVRRTETWEYASEEEFNANAAEEVLRRKQAFETTLTEDEKFIGYSFDVKKLDKSVQISIYYDIITRVA